jgi:hypothetical protein
MCVDCVLAFAKSRSSWSWSMNPSPRWFCHIFLTRTQGLDPLLDSYSASIWSCFLNLLPEFTQTTYPGNLYHIGLPDLTQSAYPNLTWTAYPILTRAPYLSLIRSHQCLSGLIISLTDLTRSAYPNLARTPYPITSMFTRPYMFKSGQTTLPDSSPVRTSTYTAELPYPILSWSDFCLLDCTQPPYPAG